MPARGLAPWRSCAAFARPALLAAAGCVMLVACSPGADYPSLFPAVHDTPPPRADTPLDASQVQQATEDLITERDRLNTEAQGAQSKTAAEAKAATTFSAKSQVKSSAKTASGPAAAQKPIRQVSGREPPSDAAPPAGAQPSNAETK